MNPSKPIDRAPDAALVLREFYHSTFDEARDHFSQKDLSELSAPFLISPTPDFLNAKIRIMFVGKETNGWNGKLTQFYVRPDSVEKLLITYEDRLKRKLQRSPFLQTLARISRELSTGDAHAIIWNNLIKMDWHRGRSDSRVAINHSDRLFDISNRIFRFEVNTLKPDIIIFGCGCSYDRAIKSSLPSYRTLEIIQPRTLWKFAVENIICYRTRHPGARRRSPHWPTADYYSYIIEDIKKAFPHAFDQNSATGVGLPLARTVNTGRVKT